MFSSVSNQPKIATVSAFVAQVADLSSFDFPFTITNVYVLISKKSPDRLLPKRVAMCGWQLIKER